MKKVNVDHIIEVNLQKVNAYDHAMWHEATAGKRFIFWWLERPKERGFGEPHGARYRTPEEYLESRSKWTRQTLMIKDGELMRKARVTVVSAGGKHPIESHEYYDTDDAAIERINEITAEFPHITINGTV